MSTLVTFHQDLPHARPSKLSMIGNGWTWLSRAVRDLRRRERERRELAGLDGAVLRELRQMAKWEGSIR